MNFNDFAIIVETEKIFDDAVISVLKSVEQKGWTLFQIYDLKERLALNKLQNIIAKNLTPNICNGNISRVLKV